MGKLQKATPPEPDAELINTQLSMIKTKLSQAFFLQVGGSDFTLDDIYKQYRGETPKKEFGAMGFYHLHGARIKKLVCIGFNLTHHIARRTFASTLLLFNNVPIEVLIAC